MLAWLRDALLGNWRNKGVALFFAVTIWFVAYQSELRVDNVTLRINLVPKQENQMIISKMSPRGPAEMAPFNGLVNMKVRGSRRRIDTFRESVPSKVEVLVETAADSGSNQMEFRFTSDNIQLTSSSLVEVVEFGPKYVVVEFDEKVEQQLQIEPRYTVPEGWERESANVEPQTVRVSGPRTVLEKMRLFATAPSLAGRDRFESTVPIEPRHETLDAMALKELVRFLDRSEVNLTVQLRYREDTLPVKNVKLRFLVPPFPTPVRIEAKESTIPILFRGPEQEIQRLAESVKDPQFFLAVEVPAFDLSLEEHSFTFTEDKLLLFGFSREIQKLQHDERKDLGPLSCTIITVKEDEKGGS